MDEVGEPQLQVGFLGFEALFHVVADVHDLVGPDLAVVAVEHLKESAHVGAFLIMRQPHVHIDLRHGVLHAAGDGAVQGDGVGDVLNADLVDRHIARVMAGLHIGDGHGHGAVGG